MLIRATIENVLSYDMPVTFSMEAGKITRQHLDHVVRIAGNPVLRGAIIYGPNAAGKSNFIKAIYLLCRMLNYDSCRLALGKQFRLTPRPRRAMSWEIIYSHNEIIYRYFVKTDGLIVLEEDLDFVQNGEFVSIFSRNRLSVCFVENITSASMIVNAISALQAFRIIRPDSVPSPDSLGALLKIDEFTDFLERLLRVADLGIDGVVWRECSRREADMVLTHGAVDGDLVQEGSRFIEWRNSMWVITMDGKKRSVHELRFKHKGVALPIGSESDGTIRMLHLSVFLFSISRTDNVWLIDEIDSHLHPFLTRFILKEFLSAAGTTSQIIATAHDTTLMSHDIWRTDEVWFAEKRVDGSSDLYSLYKYTPRFDKKLDKGYLQGLYGAIPCIGGEMLGHGEKEKK